MSIIILLKNLEKKLCVQQIVHLQKKKLFDVDKSDAITCYRAVLNVRVHVKRGWFGMLKSSVETSWSAHLLTNVDVQN